MALWLESGQKFSIFLGIRQDGVLAPAIAKSVVLMQVGVGVSGGVEAAIHPINSGTSHDSFQLTVAT